MHEVLVNCLGGLSLPRKSVVRLTDRPDMTLDVYRGRKATTTTKQQPDYKLKFFSTETLNFLKQITIFISFNPIALRKAKIVYNFGLSECNRVNSEFGVDLITLFLKYTVKLN